jgi:hypothetical protein
MTRALSAVRLDQINFGYAEATLELTQAQRLLRDGYYDLAGNEAKLLDSHEYLVLGYKGSGKSSVGARLQILAHDSPSRFVCPPAINVAELPLDSFRGVVPDSFDALQRFQHAWTLLLYTIIVDNCAKDTGAAVRVGEAMREAQRLLRKEGVEPGSPTSLRKLKTAQVESKLTLPKFYERTHTLEPTSPTNSIRIWLAYLESIIETFKSQKRHYYFLDGLDDMRIIPGGGSLLLAGLVQAVDTVNGVFRNSGAPLKVILACRTDVFGRIDSPRAGKIRRDFAVEMDWYQNPRDVKNSNLIQLINKRARLTAPNATDLIGSFFPASLLGRPSYQAVLEQTRHTPRDVLQLLKIISKHVSQPGRIDEATALAGFADFSDTYFSDEADDAMRIYFDEPSRARIKELLGTIRKRYFSISELRTRTNEDPRFQKLDVDELVTVLFNNGFLGNLTPGGPTGFQPDYYRFKYRNPRAALRWDEDLVVHPGLWKALNVA